MGQLETICEKWIILNLSKFNPIEILNLAYNINKTELYLFSKYVSNATITNILRWFLKMNYTTYQNELEETQELMDDLKQEVISEQWPGEIYKTKFQTWKDKFATQKEETNSACCLQ